jgi:carboxyl-terminal processing protease
MKRIFPILLLLVSSICSAQTSVKSLLDSVFNKAKEMSLYTASVNWDSLQKQVYLKAEHAKNIAGLKPAFETLLNGLKDFHGAVLNARNYSTIARFTDYANLNHSDTRVREPAFSKAINETPLKFEYQLLNNNIAYLKIVSIPSNVNSEVEARKIRDVINSFAKRKIEKWIIDLRYNAGGNMNPMMGALAPLIGDGIAGKLVNLQGDTLFIWEIKKGNFIYGGYQELNLPPIAKFKKIPKVAVLTSRYTVSSGELVATTLKGRPATKFFGEATGSFTTNNTWEIINDEVILNISNGIYCDRNGNVYKTNIPVDVEIPFLLVADIQKDACINAASKWLMEK